MIKAHLVVTDQLLFFRPQFYNLSENSNSSGTQTKIIPVQFQIKMAVSM